MIFLMQLPVQFTITLKDLIWFIAFYKKKNVTLKFDKSIFCKEKVNFLGYELSIDGVKPISDRLEFIITFSKPENKIQLVYWRMYLLQTIHGLRLEPVGTV